MAAILPMVKHYGAAVVALPNDHDEIPMEADKRLDLVKKILDTAVDTYGLSVDDIVIDALAMPIGADPTIVNVCYETIWRIREEFGVNMTLGAGNVSFGMPGRPCDRLGVPADGDARRAHQRDHGCKEPADGGGRQGRRPAARPRRVGRRVDRGLPRTAGRERRLMSPDADPDRPHADRTRSRPRAARGCSSLLRGRAVAARPGTTAPDGSG